MVAERIAGTSTRGERVMDIVERAKEYLASCPLADGRTFHALHPEVLVTELVAMVEELVEEVYLLEVYLLNGNQPSGDKPDENS